MADQWLANLYAYAPTLADFRHEASVLVAGMGLALILNLGFARLTKSFGRPLYTWLFVVLGVIGLVLAFAGWAKPHWLAGFAKPGPSAAELLSNFGVTLAGACFSVAVLEGVIRQYEHRSNIERELELTLSSLHQSAVFMTENLRDGSIASFDLELIHFRKLPVHQSKDKFLALQARNLNLLYTALSRCAKEAKTALEHVRPTWGAVMKSVANKDNPVEPESHFTHLEWEIDRLRRLMMLEENLGFLNSQISLLRSWERPLVIADAQEQSAFITSDGDQPDFIMPGIKFEASRNHEQDIDSLEPDVRAEDWKSIRELVEDYYLAVEAFDRIKSGMIDILNRSSLSTSSLFSRLSSAGARPRILEKSPVQLRSTDRKTPVRRAASTQVAAEPLPIEPQLANAQSEKPPTNTGFW